MGRLYFAAPEAEQYNVLWSGGGIITLIIAIAFGLHQLLLRLDLTFSSASRLLWNLLVQLMPEQLVHILRSRLSNVLPKRGSEVGSGLTAGRSPQGALGDDKVDEKEALLASSAGPRGLGNWDNSCFQNSVLQALSSLPDVQRFLGSFPAPYGNADDSTLLALRSLTRSLNSRPASGKHMWTPAQLKSMNSWQQQDAQEYYSKLMDQLEKDVNALSLKSDEVNDPGLADLNLSATPSSEKEGQDDESDDSAISMSTRKHRLNRRTPPTSPLDGLLAQRVGCLRCGYSEGLSLTPFNCMTLPLGKGPSYDVRDCLDLYMELELIEGVNCAKCTLLDVSKKVERLISTLPPPLSTSPDEDTPATNPTSFTSPYHARLAAITTALSTSSFTDETLLQSCNIPNTLRVSSTKSRQAVLMRPPKCLVLHVNRSIFDEYTGTLQKNHASVTFPMSLDLGPWCGGSVQQEKSESAWEMNPAKSMLSLHASPSPSSSPESQYTLQAVIIHYGRHENGHYICYRKTPGSDQWWRISDEDVWKVSEAEVEAQGGVFMLFYERGGMEERVEKHAQPTSNGRQDVAAGEHEGRDRGAPEAQDLTKNGKVASSDQAEESVEMLDID
jgi:ubiquitin carboxyl-terminal hydrolase 1